MPSLQDPPSNTSPLKVTIVICTRNRPDRLRACLAAVSRLDPGPACVLIVDNTVGDDNARAAALDFGARYTVEPAPGLSRARNRGLAESNTDFVAYIDDDALPRPNWLEFLLAPFHDPRVAAVTGRVETPDSTPSAETAPRFLNNSNPQWFEIATFGGLGLGSNMALRKEACNRKSMFDERLGRGAPFQIAEENYAFARLLSQGHTVAYLPLAVVAHPPLRRTSLDLEARNSISYSLLLFSEFPGQRLALLRFLFHRLQGKPLTWPRDPQGPGEIVSSGWSVKLKAGFSGLLLFLRTRKPSDR